jgi:phosphatidylcholine synthase
VASVLLTFLPINFLHPVRVRRLRRVNLAIFLVWCALGGYALLLHFETPGWVVAGVVGTGLSGFVSGFVLQIFPRLGRG